MNKIRFFLYCLVLLTYISTNAYSQDCVAIANGNWGDASTWDCDGGGIPGNGDVVVILGYGVTVNASNQYPANGNSPLLTIIVGSPDYDAITNPSLTGSISFAGKLNLFDGSQLAVYEGSSTTDDASGSSEKIRFWDADDNETASYSGTETELTGPVLVDNSSNSGVIDDFDSPLPVDLLFFDGYAVIYRSVELFWATATEENFEYFEISHSLDGKEFNVLARIDGHGTTTTRHDYSYYHASPYSGLNYYRLKSIDYDGYTEIFPLVAVQLNQQLRPQVYPNPSNGYQLKFKGLDALNPFDVEIISLDGKRLLSNKAVKGNTLTLNPALSPGLYIVNTTVGKQSFSQRLIIR